MKLSWKRRFLNILSTPKPTTFQHYLFQNDQEITPDGKNLRGIKNYNDSTFLSGYKLYWHKSGSTWQAKEIAFFKSDFNKLLKDQKVSYDDFKDSIKHDKQNKQKIIVKIDCLPDHLKSIILYSIGTFETQHTKIKPVKKGKVFHGQIRFENLCAVELGALLFVLDLPQECCHKLGMGKPLGLGSIRINISLLLSDREKRYKELFAEWDTAVEKSEKSGIDEFRNEFARFILQATGEKAPGSEPCEQLWSIERMRQLRRMLDFTNRPSDEKTKYMELGEFKERKILPSPTEISS